jgi:hypothetical protein
VKTEKIGQNQVEPHEEQKNVETRNSVGLTELLADLTELSVWFSKKSVIFQIFIGPFWPIKKI